jgi:RNA polymerase sigma-70 factor (ECF subfamily)
MSRVENAEASTSPTLLMRVRQQDPSAWNRFAYLYTPLVFRWCATNGLQSHDAADVTQEVFHSVFQGIARFQRQSAGQSLRGWLWTITRNKICDHFRRRQNEPVAAGGSNPFHEVVDVPELPAEPINDVASELTHRALALIQTDFEPSTWQAFWAMAVDGLTASEAGKAVGLSAASAYKAKSRVLHRLRHELDGMLD